MEITPKEATILLYALDNYTGADHEGNVQFGFPGYSLEEIQALRNRLFQAHIRPEESK